MKHVLHFLMIGFMVYCKKCYKNVLIKKGCNVTKISDALKQKKLELLKRIFTIRTESTFGFQTFSLLIRQNTYSAALCNVKSMSNIHMKRKQYVFVIVCAVLARVTALQLSSLFPCC